MRHTEQTREMRSEIDELSRTLRRLEFSRQPLNYYLREFETAGLVQVVLERLVWSTIAGRRTRIMMNAIAEKLAEEALTLPDNDRAALVEVLRRSLKPPIREEIDRLWAVEAERRVEGIESGKVTLVDSHEVFQEIRERFRR